MTTEVFSRLLAKPQKNELPMVTVESPYDRSPIANIEQANEADIQAALGVADQMFKDRSQWIPLPRRIEILHAVVQSMTEQAAFLALEASREGGKPLTDSLIEVERAIDGLKICVETLRTQAGEVIPMNYNAASAKRIAFTQREPIGPVVAVSAFNHPVNLIVHQVGAAVAAGCPVIVKPATDTPLSCMRIVKLFHAAGLPIEWCQAMLIADNALASQLVCDPRVAFFSFIGSARVGWHLRSQLAPGTRCALEHGGVAPVIVDETVDLKDVLPRILKGGFYHAGQVCVSVQRVYVLRSLAEDFAIALAEAAKTLTVGDPTLLETAVGPLIRPTELNRVDTWVQEAIKAGARLLCGGKAISETCYAPTVLLNPPHDVKVSQEEVFGPVVCVYSVDSFEDAIAYANALPVAFQSAVFTNNLSRAFKAYEQLAASTVMVNDHTAFRVDGMPFAGLKHSGLGTGGIPYSMRDMQVDKMLVLRHED